jgi:hypothetical protein
LFFAVGPRDGTIIDFISPRIPPGTTVPSEQLNEWAIAASLNDREDLVGFSRVLSLSCS